MRSPAPGSPPPPWWCSERMCLGLPATAARRAAGAAEVVAAASSEAGRAPALACRSSLRYAPRAPWLSLAAATATRDRALCGLPQATRRCGEAWRATEADGRLVAPLGASHAGSGLGGGRCSSGDEGGLASRLCAAPIGGSRGLEGTLLLGIGITSQSLKPPTGPPTWLRHRRGVQSSNNSGALRSVQPAPPRACPPSHRRRRSRARGFSNGPASRRP